MKNGGLAPLGTPLVLVFDLKKIRDALGMNVTGQTRCGV
jgi:hypothetical protein